MRAVVVLLVGVGLASCGAGGPQAPSASGPQLPEPAAAAIELTQSDVPADLPRCSGTGWFRDLTKLEQAGASESDTVTFANDKFVCSPTSVPRVRLRFAAAAVVRYKDVNAASKAFHAVLLPPDSTGAETVVGSGTGFGKNSVLSQPIPLGGGTGLYGIDWQRGPYIVRFQSANLSPSEEAVATTAINGRIPPTWSPCGEAHSLAAGCVGAAGVKGTVGYYQCGMGASPPACPFFTVQAVVYAAAQQAPSGTLSRPLVNQLTAADGVFELHLPPGTYWVGADSLYGWAELQFKVPSGAISETRLLLPER